MAEVQARSEDAIRADLATISGYVSAPLVNAPNAFIRLANDVPALLAELAAVRAENERLREAWQSERRTRESMTSLADENIDKRRRAEAAVADARRAQDEAERLIETEGSEPPSDWDDQVAEGWMEGMRNSLSLLRSARASRPSLPDTENNR